MAYSKHREKRNAYKILIGKPEGKSLLGIRRWDDNTKTDLQVGNESSGSVKC
jgi:hypothetical protein